MSIVLQVVILGFGILISLFIVWKKLREDYPDNEIFLLSLGIIAGAAAGYFGATLAHLVVGDLRFWGAVFGGFSAGIALTRKLSMRGFEVLEAFVPASAVYLLFVWVTRVPWLSFGRTPEFLRILAGLGIVVLSLLVYLYFSKSYRRFLWYPSGKLGLASLVSLVFFFLGRAVLANIASGVLPWLERILDTAFGVIGGTLILVVLYLRSGRNARKDFGF